MKIKYYVRYVLWIPRAFLRELSYRFWTGYRGTRFWRDANGKLIGPRMTSEEYDKWFKK